MTKSHFENDSIPTITKAEVQAMVEAMDKMTEELEKLPPEKFRQAMVGIGEMIRQSGWLEEE